LRSSGDGSATSCDRGRICEALASVLAWIVGQWPTEVPADDLGDWLVDVKGQILTEVASQRSQPSQYKVR
jgi:hypothetical protein